MEANIKMYKDKPCKEAQVVMLPTKDEIDFPILKSLQNNNTLNKLYLPTKVVKYPDNYCITKEWEKQHLYITTDEEIKEGGWFIGNSMGAKLEDIKRCKFIKDNIYYTSEDEGYGIARKIVASTDPKLKLPQPSQDFIEAYCKAGGIDKVLVELNEFESCYNYNGAHLHKDCSCKGGDFRQDIKIKPDNTIIIHPFKEKTYTKNDMFKAFMYGFQNDGGKLEQDLVEVLLSRFDKWIEKIDD